MILIRREEAPEALSRLLADQFATSFVQDLRQQVTRRTFTLKFRHTLSALAGLFRWCVREPYAFLATRETIAAELRATLAETEGLLMKPVYSTVRQVEQKRQQMHKIIEFSTNAETPTSFGSSSRTTMTTTNHDRWG